MRPGSEVYANEHGSYGIATLRRKHVNVKGDLIEFDFPGKSGVRQQHQLRDRQVARVIRDTMKTARASMCSSIRMVTATQPKSRDDTLTSTSRK
jgi:DNA topoisomerase IB